jgi:hypothetical protein
MEQLDINIFDSLKMVISKKGDKTILNPNWTTRYPWNK